jgi:hypothetical protein
LGVHLEVPENPSRSMMTADMIALAVPNAAAFSLDMASLLQGKPHLASGHNKQTREARKMP